MVLEEIICIHKGSDKLYDCEKCCGTTSLCGKYENVNGIDPFEKLFSDRRNVKERRKQMYIDEEVGLWY